MVCVTLDRQALVAAPAFPDIKVQTVIKVSVLVLFEESVVPFLVLFLVVKLVVTSASVLLVLVLCFRTS